MKDSHIPGNATPAAVIQRIAKEMGRGWEKKIIDAGDDLLRGVTQKYPDRVITSICADFMDTRIVICFYTRALVGEQTAWAEL